MKRLRIYPDTSVFGGCFDEEFVDDSRKLFNEIKEGRFVLVLSATTLRELADAPKQTLRLLEEIPEEFIEVVASSDEIRTLRDAYIEAGVVGSISLLDAEHIAGASIANVDIIVSWNFRHIVNFQKIRGYHAVNLLNGYHPISIHSPNEVIEK